MITLRVSSQQIRAGDMVTFYVESDRPGESILIVKEGLEALTSSTLGSVLADGQGRGSLSVPMYETGYSTYSAQAALGGLLRIDMSNSVGITVLRNAEAQALYDPGFYGNVTLAGQNLAQGAANAATTASILGFLLPFAVIVVLVMYLMTLKKGVGKAVGG